jgi:hypothetical protein
MQLVSKAAIHDAVHISQQSVHAIADSSSHSVPYTRRRCVQLCTKFLSNRSESIDKTGIN